MKCVILGGGPAGSALATFLARDGADVVVVDARPEPLAGVGESLIPLCADVLTELGVDMAGFLVKHGAVFTRDGAPVRFRFDEAVRSSFPFAWQVPRDRFDRRLRDVAAAHGARFVHTRVLDFAPGTVRTEAGDLSCDWFVDAGGRTQFLARKLGIHTVHPRLRNAARTAWHRGVRTLDPEQPGDIAITTFDGGWFWFIPFGDGVTSVGVVSTPRGPRGKDAWDEALSLCPDARARLDGATPIEPLRGAQDFSVSATALHGPGWALCGDAGLFLDPVFSTGVCLALHGARGLARALTTGDLDGWERAYRDAAAVVEPVIEGFYAGEFMDVALSHEATRHEGVRRAVVSLLAGDFFDPSFTASRRMARRFGELAARVRA